MDASVEERGNSRRDGRGGRNGKSPRREANSDEVMMSGVRVEDFFFVFACPGKRDLT